MRFADDWTDATVTELRLVAPDVREITIRPSRPCASAPAAGAHIRVALTINGAPDTRCYSLTGIARRDEWRIAVRLAPDSRGGSRAMWNLSEGAHLRVTQPATLFEIDWQREHFCLIAGGVGITPLTGIAERLVQRGADMTLHYAVRSREAAAYIRELQALLKERLIIHESGAGNRLDLHAVLAGLPTRTQVALCGPMRMLDDARKCWHDLGRPADDLRYETFGTSGQLPTSPFRVHVAQGGEIIVREDQSMLAALNEAGFEVISDCERGECGVCAIDVTAIDGALDHRDVFFSDHQKKQGQKICPCVSRALGTVTVDTLYRASA